MPVPPPVMIATLPGRARLGTLKGIGIVRLLVVSLRTPLRPQAFGLTAVAQAYTLGPGYPPGSIHVDRQPAGRAGAHAHRRRPVGEERLLDVGAALARPTALDYDSPARTGWA
jgi:hypothetical protein